MTNNINVSKKRKIEEQSPQEEEKNVDFPPPFATDVLHHRMQTGIMVQSGGQKGSLTRCVQKFALYAQEGSNSSSKARDELLQDLKLYQLDLTRRVLLQQNLEKERNENEKNALNLKQEIADLTTQVKESFQKAESAKQVQSCFMEYEALAKLANSNSTTSSRQLRSEIQKVKQEIAEYEQEEAKLDKTLYVRSSQFQALIQCMLDMKRSLEDKQLEEDIEKHVKKTKEAKDNEEEDSKPAATDMQVDEDDLYGDI